MKIKQFGDNNILHDFQLLNIIKNVELYHNSFLSRPSLKFYLLTLKKAENSYELYPAIKIPSRALITYCIKSKNLDIIWEYFIKICGFD